MWKQGTAEIRHTGGPIAWAASAPHRQELFACHAASPLPSNEPAELTACDNGSNWKQITHLHQAGNVIPVTGGVHSNWEDQRGPRCVEQSAGPEARPCHGLTSTWSTWTLKAALSDLFSGFSGNGRKKNGLIVS